MKLTIDGYPATLDVPEDCHVVDVVLVARVVRNDDARHDHVTLGGTDHTGGLVRDMILEHGQFACDMADELTEE